MKRASGYLFFVACVISFFESSALPGQAGHCNQGPIGNQSGYIGPHGSSGGGSLTNGDYVVKVDGTEINNIDTTELTVGVEYTFTLEREGSFDFRGFMLRLEDGFGSLDVSGSFTVASSNIQLHPSCSNPKISAVTHNNRFDKSSVEFKVTINQPAEWLRLDTTVVRTQSFGNWYYSLFNLKVVPELDLSSAPSAVPSDVPSSAPSTGPPTPSPFCVDSPLFFIDNGKKRSCKGFLKKNTAARCSKRNIHTHCPATCKEFVTDACDEPTNSSKSFVLMKRSDTEYNCSWTGQRKGKRCPKKNYGVAKTCRKNCINYL